MNQDPPLKTFDMIRASEHVSRKGDPRGHAFEHEEIIWRIRVGSRGTKKKSDENCLSDINVVDCVLEGTIDQDHHD